MKKRYTAILAAAVLTAGVLAGCGAGSQADIGQEKAQSIALEDVGVSEGDVTRLKVSKEREDGMLQYDVQFDVDGKEYSYEINGGNGEILSSEVETITNSATVSNNGSSQNSATVTPEANASEQTNANVSNDTQAADNSSNGAASTTDNGNTGNSNAGNTGNNAGAATGSGQNAANVAISDAQARQAALERVPGATEADIRMELDFDDGYYIYEGDIIYQQVEYEFEIDAQTGNFLKWSEERH